LTDEDISTAQRNQGSAQYICCTRESSSHVNVSAIVNRDRPAQVGSGTTHSFCPVGITSRIQLHDKTILSLRGQCGAYTSCTVSAKRNTSSVKITGQVHIAGSIHCNIITCFYTGPPDATGPSLHNTLRRHDPREG